MDFINSYKNQLLSINKQTFSENALKLFRFQVNKNFGYKSFVEKLNIPIATITSLEKIPFLPVSLFKSHKILLNDYETENYFSSSGTTGSVRSMHYVPDMELYAKVVHAIFRNFYTDLKQSVILALLPSYLENPHSSLIFMIKAFIASSNDPLSGFVKDTSDLLQKVKAGQKKGKKVYLFGVSYALMDLAEEKADLAGVTVIETGGMKGRRKEITREGLHAILKKGLNVSEISSEYGMTELLSQAYTLGDSIFRIPPWMHVSTREINDPFADNSGQRTGILKIIDLANIYSCAFIETEDLGFITQEGFQVLGRLDNTELRGCNLMYNA